MDTIIAILVVASSASTYLCGYYAGKVRTEAKVYVAATKLMTPENADTVSALVDEIMYK